MPLYRVYATEMGHTTRAVSVDYWADSPDDAASMYHCDEAPDDYSVDDYDFDRDDQFVDDVVLIHE